MKFVVFSKPLASLDPAALGVLAARAGFDGIDLCVRDGHPVTPGNAKRMLPDTVQAIADAGLSVPMISLPTTLVDPGSPEAKSAVAAAGRCGVSLIKPGYPLIDPTQSAAAQLQQARRSVLGWQQLAVEHGVQMAWHIHSGPCFGCNASSMAMLLQDCDPTATRIYIDPAHLLLDGEEPAIAWALCETAVSAIGLKDVLIRRSDTGRHGQIDIDWPPAGRGMVDWSAWADLLVDGGFDGVCSVHAEFDLPPNDACAVLQHERAFFANLFSNPTSA